MFLRSYPNINSKWYIKVLPNRVSYVFYYKNRDCRYTENVAQLVKTKCLSVIGYLKPIFLTCNNYLRIVESL